MSESLLVELDARIEKFNRKVDEATKSVDGLDRGAKQAELSVKRFDLSTIAAGVSVGLLASKLNGLAETYTNTQNLLVNVTKGTDDLANVTDKLFKVAEASRSEYEATATLYARLARATKDLNVSQDELLRITETINKAFKAGGATTQEAAAATVQLSQALASGVLRGDEFNSIAEQAPAILDAVAFATGKARGELRELAADGQISADVLIKSLKLYANTIDGEFNNTVATFSDKVAIANNELTKLVGGTGAVANVTRVAGDALIFMTKNLDDFAVIVGGGLFIAALANLKTLNALLKANPYVFAATALGTFTAALADFLNTAGDDAIKDAEKRLFAEKTVNDMLTEQTTKLEGLALKRQELEKLRDGGNPNINRSEMQERIDLLNQEIEQTVTLMAKLQELQQERGGEAVISGVKTSGSAQSSGKGSVELDDGELKKLESEYEIFQQRLQQSEDFNAARTEQEQAHLDATLNKIWENDQVRLETLQNFAMTREEIIAESFRREMEMLDEYKEKTGATEQEIADRRIEIAEKHMKMQEAIKKKEVKDTRQTEAQKWQSIEAGIGAAMALNSAFLNDNKLIKAGLIVADTAAAIMRSLSINPYDWGNVAIIGATGLVQLANALSADKGGGGGVSAPSGSTTTITNPPPDSQRQTTEFEVSSVVAGESSGRTRVGISLDDSEDFVDALANAMAQRMKAV